MKRHSRDQYAILQGIRQRAAIKSTIRRKWFLASKRKKTDVVIDVSISIPRSFRRTSIKDGPLNLQRNVGISERKAICLRNNMPTILKYITESEKSPFYLKSIKKEKFVSSGRILIPKEFSLIDNPKESYDALRRLLSALFFEGNDEVILDYVQCVNSDLNAQILLDIILVDYVKFRNKSADSDRQKRRLYPNIGAININNQGVRKMIFSVGSPVNLKLHEDYFPDIEKYKLKVYNKDDNFARKNKNLREAQKEIDTTGLVDYVLSCLKHVNKKLTPRKLDDLCTVIGEMLINAEEHSSTPYRYSIGYFNEDSNNTGHFGVFRLVILNFGDSIYEKFKSKDCPNKDVVAQMKDLSEKYVKKLFFSDGEFNEESLWTLYALQEGVSSVSTDKFKRGNGSIRFIESFFNIKGSNDKDDTSRMIILSGNAKIIFDGTYRITENMEKFKLMTFNATGSLENKPDSQYVKCSEFYFPGTLISAKILINDDDVTKIQS